jgi:rhamnogalacturonyl hydrolase YesR
MIQRKLIQFSVPFVIALSALFVFLSPVRAQLADAEKKSWVGDAPLLAPPPAQLSPALKRNAVLKAMRLVGDWQLKRAEAGFDQDWTFAALYAGFMSVPDGAGGAAYRKAMLRMGNKFSWEPGPRMGHADDEAIGQTYLDLYLQLRNPSMLGPIRANIDSVMRQPDDPQKPLWWWCDALFMAPPVLVRLYEATGDRKYLDFMDREWWITSDLLYNGADHLYSRDKSFLGAKEANGKGLYWSRGNGWVMAGLVRVLSVLPADYPSRPKYVAQFREMADKVASIQGEDGLWRPGLLDPAAYKLPEVSGSAFYTYALAYGVNSGILDRERFLPVVKKAWKGLLTNVYADGRLGCVQPIGAAPGDYTPTSSYVFGTGAFLLAGSEVYRLAN